MNKLFILIFVGLITLHSCNIDNQSKNVDLDLEMEKVALVLEKYVIANEKQDMDLIKEIWAPETDIMIFGTNSDEQLIGWEQIRDAVQRQFNLFEDTYISVHDQVIQINECGNTAWFSEIVNYNFIYQGEAKQFEGVRFTGILEKFNGDWLIVQSHMSIPASPD